MKYKLLETLASFAGLITYDMFHIGMACNAMLTQKSLAFELDINGKKIAFGWFYNKESGYITMEEYDLDNKKFSKLEFRPKDGKIEVYKQQQFYDGFSVYNLVRVYVIRRRGVIMREVQRVALATLDEKFELITSDEKFDRRSMLKFKFVSKFKDVYSFIQKDGQVLMRDSDGNLLYSVDVKRN